MGASTNYGSVSWAGKFFICLISHNILDHAEPECLAESSVMNAEGMTPFDPKAFLAKVGPGKTITELDKRQIVFSQGDPADAVFYIQKGQIELRVLSEQGKEAILAIMGADQFFGEGCLAGQPLRMMTATAL